MSEPGSLLRSLLGRMTARNFHSHVIHELGTGVISGKFPAGSVLPSDAELMDKFEVSRTVLREAIKTLEAKGLVEARPKVGTKVAKRHRWNLFDPQVLAWHLGTPPDEAFIAGLHEIRFQLEPLAARNVAERRTGEQIRLMYYWLRQMELSRDDVNSFCLADFEIHRIIADASSNPFMPALTGVIELSHAFAYRRLMLAQSDGERMGAFIEPHRRLLGFIESGDIVGSYSAMQAVILFERLEALGDDTEECGAL